MKKSIFISEFCLTGKSDGGKFTLRAVTADPISDTNPISLKKRNKSYISQKRSKSYLKKVTNPISLKTS